MKNTYSDVFAVIKNISNSKTEDEVRFLTKKIVQQSGGEYFVFSTLRSTRNCLNCSELPHYFEDCSPEWRRIYNERKWFMNDPFIEYSKFHTEPTVGSMIHANTTGQLDMLSKASVHGFRSCIVIPTHSSLGPNDWLGMFLVGSSSESGLGESILSANRVIFRALAMELADWWKNRFKSDAINRFKIDEKEINILQHLKNGKAIPEIAAIMDVRSRLLYQRIGAVKDKLNALETTDAIQIAKTYGLLG